MWNRDVSTFRQQYYRNSSMVFRDASYASAIERHRTIGVGEALIGWAVMLGFCLLVAYAAVRWWFE